MHAEEFLHGFSGSSRIHVARFKFACRSSVGLAALAGRFAAQGVWGSSTLCGFLSTPPKCAVSGALSTEGGEGVAASVSEWAFPRLADAHRYDKRPKVSRSFCGRPALGRLGRVLGRRRFRAVGRLVLGQDRGLDVEVEQFPRLQSAGSGEFFKRSEMELVFTAGFEGLVVLIFETGTFGERLLAESERLSELLYPRKQSFRCVVCHDKD